MSKLKISSFLRVDDNMLEIVLPHVAFAYPHKGHRAIWAIPIDVKSPGLIAWLNAQDVDSFAGGFYIPMDNGTLIPAATTATHIGLGVSYSQLDINQIKRIAVKSAMRIIDTADFQYVEHAVATDNPLLRLNMARRMYYYETNKTAIKPNARKHIHSKLSRREAEFIDSLTGHDFFYEYSDSIEVYRSGKRHEEILKEAGIKMGLTHERVNELYKLAYREKCTK